MAVAPEDVKPIKKPEGFGVSDKTTHYVNKLCFFTISDFVEDRVRIRCLNVVAFSLIYVYFVFALLKTTPAPEPRLKNVRFANPPPSAWVSGDMSADLKSFFIGTGSLPNRSQKLFAVDDSGSPMRNAIVEVKATNFVGDGPLPCSKAQQDAMAGTLEARRLQHVCRYEIAYNAGPTDQGGMISLTNFSVRGPAGMYTLVPTANGISSTEAASMLVSTPVASLEVVNLSTPDLELVPPPTSVAVGVPFAWQPTILVRDMNGLPVPGRQIVAFANPDPAWPPEGPASRVERYERRGQKVVELNCPESGLSDARGIATFTCLGINSSNVDHVSIVFAESALVFSPWNDPVYSPRNLYPLPVEKFRYPIYIKPRAAEVKVTTKVPANVTEGVPFDPQPALTVLDSSGQPAAGVRCYALLSIEGFLRNPNWYRRKLKGVKSKDLINAEATTDADGIAQFSGLKLSVAGNTRDIGLAGRWEPTSFPYSIDFNCDGTWQESHAWSTTSGGYITEVASVVSTVRIKRFIRSTAELGRYNIEPAANGSNTFLAVVRVLDAAGNGVAGKSLDVTNIAGNAAVEIAPDDVEATNDQGFAVVAFQAIWGLQELAESGSLQFRVRFKCDGVESADSQNLTVRVVGKLNPEVCQQLVPVTASFYNIASGQSTTLSGPPPYVMQSGDIFFTSVRLQGAVNCVHFPSVSETNTSECFDLSGLLQSRRLHEELSQLHEDLGRRLRESPGDFLAESRKLQTNDGNLIVGARSAYSNDQDLAGYVRFEPRPMLQVSFLHGLGLTPAPVPTNLREYNADPKYITWASQFEGPSGDHWVQPAVETQHPDGTVQVCWSKPIPLRIENTVADILVEGDGGPGAYFEKEIDAGSFVDIDLSFILEPSLGDPNDLSRLPNCIKLSEEAVGFVACYVKFTFVEAPFNFHQLLSMTDGRGPEPKKLQTDQYKIYPVQKTNTTNVDGYDTATGKLHLRFQMNQKGVYGDFGIQFRGFGVNSRVFTWRVRPPPGLRLEVVQDPRFILVPPFSGNLLDQAPIVRVTSDDGPVDGLVLSYDLVPEPGAHFTKLTVIPMYSTFPFLYSAFSGEEVTDAYGRVQPAQPGIAYFPIMGIVDGFGCTRMRFIAEGVSTDPVPENPLCLTAPYFYQIVGQPPLTWPLNIGLNEFGGSIAVEVRAYAGMTQFTQHLGGLLVRLLVSSEGGKDQPDATTAGELAQRMLADAVCVFVNFKEAIQRCSPLELVQTTPYPVLRFSFLGVRWVRRISQPARIILKVSDLTGSDYRSVVEKPENFESMTTVEQFQVCNDAVQETLSGTQASSTAEISAETAASQYFIALQPPEIATVGSVFLVRLRVTTASGGPVRDVRVRAGIQKAAATSPSSAGPAMLQSMAQKGKRLEVLADGTVELDSDTTIRVSNRNGIISFPLTITRAISGTYKLLFQPDVPDGRVVLETSNFKVENPIFRIYSTESAWGQFEIPDFGKLVALPKTPVFCVETATNESLAQLQSAGVRTRIKLTLKGAPSKQETTATRLAAAAKESAKQSLQNSANNMAAVLSQESSGFMKQAVDHFVNQSASAARGSFAGLTSEFAEACMMTPLKQMQVGDPFTELSFGTLKTAGLAALQNPSLSEALGMDPSALEPSQVLDQFSQVLMSAGAQSSSPSNKIPAAEWDFFLEDLSFESNCSYAFKASPVFSFVENMEYEFTVSVNGVESSADGLAFKVVRKPPDPVDVAFNWFCSGVAGIVGVIILTTNVTKHKWHWFVFAILCTVGMLVAAPFLAVHRDALYGAWIYFALIDLVLILVALFFGMGTEVSQKGRTFDQQRQEIFEAYTQKRLKQALGHEIVTAEKAVKQSLISSVRRTFFTPFNADDAFFFPSALLVANLLAFLSFAYIFAQSIQVLWALEKLFNKILNTALEKSIGLIVNVNQAYFQMVNADLPDSSTEFMYVQIDLMRSWFQQLIDAVIVGFTVGIVVAAILTTVAILGHFVHFRQSVMDARLGKFNFKKSNAKIVFSTGFIGISISSAIVSYILIVGLVTIILLPFCFSLTWNVIWRQLPTIIFTFVIPKIISFVSMKICKKCLFGPTFVKTRAGASIFHFYMTFLALPGGVVTAITRFVMGLVGVLVMLPVTYGANTPDFVNSYMLLDTTYRTYIGYVMMFSCHNNPIMIAAANRMLAIKAEREVHEQAGKHWTSSRSMLLLILLRFPQLRKLRKHVLAEEKRVRELLKLPQKKPIDYEDEDRDDEDEEARPEPESAVTVQVKGAKVRREPWIENALANAMVSASTANRRVELMKKYAIVLAGLQADTEQYTRVKAAMRELALPGGKLVEPETFGL